MRRIIGYLFIVAAFLAVVFLLNGVRAVIDKQEARPKKPQQTAGKARKQADSSFSSHLPLVVIETDGQQIQKDRETWAKISVIDNETGNNHLGDTSDFTAAAAIRHRGNSSYLAFDKKQYRIEFREEYGKKKNKKYSVLGMSAGSDWVLNGPFLDRSLVRNRLIYGVSRELFSWSPDTRYCEVFLDGEYQGVYLLIEPVTNEEGRLNLADFGLVSGQTAYMLQREMPNTEENEIDSFGMKNGITSFPLSISFPPRGRLTESQRQWIEHDINEFERALYSNRFDNPYDGYAAYIDMDSFLNYYIINELTLTKAGYLSTYVYKDLGGKLKITVWDFNNSYDNYQEEVFSVEKFYVAESDWYNRLFQDRKFTDRVVARYRELRKGVLSEENLLRRVDENVAYLGKAIDRNFEIWGYTFNERLLLSRDKHGNNRDPESYEEAVQQLKRSIVERGDFLDQNIDKLYQYNIN